MKKFLTILILSVLLAGCSVGSNDKQLLDEYYKKQFANPFTIDTFEYKEYTSRAVGSVDIPGLNYVYTVHFSYSVPSAIETSSSSGWGGSMITFTVSTSALKVDPVDIPIDVTVSADCGFNKTYTKTLRYKTYTEYFANIFAKEARVSYDSATNKNGVSELYEQSISSGHFYSDYYNIFDFNNKTYTYKLIKYEHDIYGSYNQTEYVATYYFGDSNPRIEGLTTGTYYVGSGSYSSSDRNDDLVYFRCIQLNNLFKNYSDSRFITSIS